MWKTSGHESVKRILDLQAKQQVFPHAYLFVGPAGIGKQDVAYEFASKILNSTVPVANHPDFIAHNAAEESGVESMRNLLSRLSVKPFTADYKVAVIYNFETANTQTANALLKTLEEPSPSTIIILISASRALLPTVISRVQEFVFNPLPNAEIQVSPEIAELVNKLELGFESDIADRLLLLNQLSELESETLTEMLTVLTARLRATLSKMPERGALISRVCETIESLRRSFNKKMVLQHLLIPQN